MKISHLFCIVFLVITSRTSFGKPLPDIESAIINPSIKWSEYTSLNQLMPDRYKRQSRRLFNPPQDEFDDEEGSNEIETVNINKKKESTTSRSPIIVTQYPPRANGNEQRPRGGIGSRLGGMLTSIMRSSAPQRPWLKSGNAEERNARIRRQVEQILTQLQKTMNQTESQNQIESDDDESADKSPEDSSSSSEEDEPPGGGDGMGGGIFGLLAGLSGGDGESDLGTLLATFGGLIASLSGGPGFDLNTLIGSAAALIGGISAGDGSKNIGAQIAEYLVTILEGFTGGGAMNNGAFFGNLAGSLIAGSSAAGEGGSSEEKGSDSAAFFLSLFSSILGSSSGGED